MVALYSNFVWIFDIVANKVNSVDVDKFDYLSRDPYYSGISVTKFDFQILMKNIRVVEN